MNIVKEIRMLENEIFQEMKKQKELEAMEKGIQYQKNTELLFEGEEENLSLSSSGEEPNER